LKSDSFNLLEASGPVHSCAGIALPPSSSHSIFKKKLGILISLHAKMFLHSKLVLSPFLSAAETAMLARISYQTAALCIFEKLN
jgi:hypothetical protein